MVTLYCPRQVKDPSFGYLVNRTNVRILVEWLQSSVLFQSTYHNYDDVSRDDDWQSNCFTSVKLERNTQPWIKLIWELFRPVKYTKEFSISIFCQI